MFGLFLIKFPSPSVIVWVASIVDKLLKVYIGVQLLMNTVPQFQHGSTHLIVFKSMINVLTTLIIRVRNS